MRTLLQDRLRTLLILIGVFACSLAMFVSPYVVQRQLIARLMERDVYIATQTAIPDWLWRPQFLDKLIVAPIQAQVLSNPTTPDRIRALGKEMSYESAESELLRLRSELRDELGLQHFVLVEGGRVPRGAMMNLFALCEKLGTITTPCGITNFPDFADASASGRETDAEPGDAREREYACTKW